MGIEAIYGGINGYGRDLWVWELVLIKGFTGCGMVDFFFLSLMSKINGKKATEDTFSLTLVLTKVTGNII